MLGNQPNDPGQTGGKVEVGKMKEITCRKSDGHGNELDKGRGDHLQQIVQAAHHVMSPLSPRWKHEIRLFGI